MCGIAGWISPVEAEDCLQAMTNTLAHRGPDGEGHAVLPMAGGMVAAFGHRRLSILDLSTGGQPMVSHDGRFWSSGQRSRRCSAIPPELDIASLRSDLAWRYVPSPDTLFRRIHKLTPGSYLIWGPDGEVERQRYWLPPEARDDPGPPPASRIKAFPAFAPSLSGSAAILPLNCRWPRKRLARLAQVTRRSSWSPKI